MTLSVAAVLVWGMLAVAVLLAILAVGGPAGRDRRTRRSIGIDTVGLTGDGQPPMARTDADLRRPTRHNRPSSLRRRPRWLLLAGTAVGAVVMAATPGLALVALLVSAGWLIATRVAWRQAAARRLAIRAEAAPAVLDLLGAALLAGLNPHLAVLRVAERVPEILQDELALAAAVLRLGGTPAAAMRAAAERSGLDELGAAAGALEAAERWGAPPAEALAARAEALRSRARLRAEAEAGRAAVRITFPLVLCFLPAFVLLIVVPAVAGSLRALAP